MSDAHKCDRCDALFDKLDGGHVVLDVQIQQDVTNTYDSWTDVDLCRKCGEEVLDAIGPAIDRRKRRSKA
jgi:hypothetical protein